MCARSGVDVWTCAFKSQLSDEQDKATDGNYKILYEGVLVLYCHRMHLRHLLGFTSLFLSGKRSCYSTCYKPSGLPNSV